MDWWKYRGFRSGNAGVRQQAAIDCGVVRDVKAVARLIGLLNDPDRNVRRSAVGALERIADRRATPPLLSLLRDRDEDIVDAALTALGEIRDRTALAPLLRMYPEASFEQAPKFLRAIEQIDANWKTHQGLGELVPLLIGHLEHSQIRVRERSARLLAYIGDARAAEALVRAQADASPEVRLWASHGARALKASGAIHPLVAFAAVGSYGTPAITLRSPGEAGATEKLGAILTTTAMSILAEIGDAEAVPALIENYRRWRRGDGPEVSYDRRPSAPIEDYQLGHAPIAALEGILSRSIGAMSEADLRSVAALEDTHWNVRVDFGSSGADESTVSVPCGHLRNQALGELRRRGLPGV